MPKIEQKYPDVPKFSDLKLGERLSIVGVEKTKTEKNGYDAAYLTLQGGKKLFVIEAGVLYQLGLVKGAISNKDPLNVVVAEYKDKFGEMRRTIKNV